MAEAAFPTEGAYVKANGLDVHYLQSGSGNPLILLHGGMTSSNSWRELIPGFAEHFQVFAPDRRAHGRTKHPGGEQSYALLADDVAAFAQILGLKKPLICGYSGGGQIALEVGMRHPELASGLVIGAATAWYSAAYYQTMASWGFEAPGVVDYAYIEAHRGDMVSYLRNEHAALGGPDYWRTLLLWGSTTWLTPLSYSAEELSKIIAPALVLLGDRDETVPVEQAVALYRALTGGELAIMPQTTHQTGMRESFVSLALDFLLRHRPNAVESTADTRTG